MKWQDHIHRDPAICFGKPVFCGTRLSVAHVLERMHAGWSDTVLRDQFPRLTQEHLAAARLYHTEHPRGLPRAKASSAA